MSEISRKLTLFRASILQLNEDVQNVLKERNTAVEEEENNFLNPFEFPIKTFENLEVEVEEYLRENIKFKLAVSY